MPSSENPRVWRLGRGARRRWRPKGHSHPGCECHRSQAGSLCPFPTSPPNGQSSPPKHRHLKTSQTGLKLAPFYPVPLFVASPRSHDFPSATGTRSLKTGVSELLQCTEHPLILRPRMMRQSFADDFRVPWRDATSARGDRRCWARWLTTGTATASPMALYASV
jgi:hypothetical protein